MNTDNGWSMAVFVAEIDGETDAEAYLTRADNRNFSGRGRAKLNPADQDVAMIGEEIAIARALSDLSHKLLHSAAVGHRAGHGVPVGFGSGRLLKPERGTAFPQPGPAAVAVITVWAGAGLTMRSRA